MVFVKVIKNKAWFKRYQVKYRRRREGKTDYFARRKMVRQDKNKYNAKKFRLIVRITNRQVICQVAYATLLGDIVVAAASSKDLAAYDIEVGLKNYSAAYCTGLLCARRCLKKYGLDKMFEGKKEIDGEEYHIEDDEEAERKPFKAILDVGIASTSKGCRLWGALKGAVDGGLHVPHNAKKFPGFEASEEKGVESKYDAEAHKERIFGGHVGEYMSMMKEEDPTKYEAHFAKFIEAGIDAEKLEDMYSDAHAQIREDPNAGRKEKKKITWTRKGNMVKSSDGKEHQRSVKLTLRQRKAKVAQKIKMAQDKMQEAGDDE
jgi:large subunit ribosomal protein L5e